MIIIVRRISTTEERSPEESVSSASQTTLLGASCSEQPVLELCTVTNHLGDLLISFYFIIEFRLFLREEPMFMCCWKTMSARVVRQEGDPEVEKEVQPLETRKLMR